MWQAMVAVPICCSILICTGLILCIITSQELISGKQAVTIACPVAANPCFSLHVLHGQEIKVNSLDQQLCMSIQQKHTGCFAKRGVL